MMDPIAMAMMGASSDPQRWGPILDQMRIPLPGTPEFNQLFPQAQNGALMPGADQNIGAALNGVGTQVPGVTTSQPTAVAGTPSPTPGMPPPGAPPPGVMPPQPNAVPQVAPQVRMPTVPSPVFAGGVSSSQKAPDAAFNSTAPSTAQMLLQALMSGGQQNPLRVPALGSILRGGRY